MIWADSLVGNLGGEDGVREFIGNVRFRQGNVTVSCDKAIHNSSQNSAEMFGRVVVIQGALRISAPHMHYLGTTGVADADGGVRISDGPVNASSNAVRYVLKPKTVTLCGDSRIEDDSTILFADTAIHNRGSKATRAWGRTVLVAKDSSYAIIADTMEHDPRNKHSIATGNSVLWHFTLADSADSNSVPDTATVSARIIEKFGSSDSIYLARGQVQIVDHNATVVADSVHMDRRAGITRFWIAPFVWADSSVLKADSISFVSSADSLKEIKGMGRGFLLTQGDTSRLGRTDQLSADLIRIDVEGGRISGLVGIGDARSINYNTGDDDGDGLVQFTSDTIAAVFQAGSVKDIFWLGGVHGEHHPESVVTGREAQFKLPGYPDVPAKPKKKPVDILRDYLIFRKR